MNNSEQSPSRREYIAGVPCDFISQEEYRHKLQDALKGDSLTHIVTLNAEMVVQAQHDTAFKQAIQRAELSVPDSAGILWAREYAHSKKNPLSFLLSKQKRLTGIDSIFLICEKLEKQHGIAYLLGGEEQDREKTAEILQKKYAELSIKSLSDDNINNLQLTTHNLPSVAFVALGAPKQTLWIEEHKTQLEQAGIRIAIGIGGAFAMISGRLPRAPKWMRTAHLEWLWRLLLEPKRIKRIWNAVIIFPRIVFGYPHTLV